MNKEDLELIGDLKGLIDIQSQQINNLKEQIGLISETLAIQTKGLKELTGITTDIVRGQIK